MNALKSVGVKHKLDERERIGMTMLAHFGYGASVGGLFGLFAPRDPAKSLAAGIGYGLFVWAGSYLGLLPSLGLHRPATREPAERNALMILAHIVWGATLGVLAPTLARAGKIR